MHRSNLVYTEKLPARCVFHKNALFARDVPICEIPSLFDNAAQILTLHNSILVSFWQLNGTQIVLGDRLRRTKEPAKWRQSELFPKART